MYGECLLNKDSKCCAYKKGFSHNTSVGIGIHVLGGSVPAVRVIDNFAKPAALTIL
jgi:hypothetical protein